MQTSYIHSYAYVTAFNDAQCTSIVKYANAHIASALQQAAQRGQPLDQLILSFYLPQSRTGTAIGAFYAGETYSLNDNHNSPAIAADLHAAYDLRKATQPASGSYIATANLLIYNGGAVTILSAMLQ